MGCEELEGNIMQELGPIFINKDTVIISIIFIKNCPILKRVLNLVIKSHLLCGASRTFLINPNPRGAKIAFWGAKMAIP